MTIGSLTPDDWKASSRKAGGFQLVELLVVIGIFAILASMLLPGLSRAKESARRIQCMNNLRQLSVTWSLYHDDNEDRLAPNGYGTADELEGRRLWVVGTTHRDPPGFTNIDYLLNPRYAAFADYLHERRIYKCPSDRSTIEIGGKKYPKVRTYALNGYLGWESPDYRSMALFLSPENRLYLKSADLAAAPPSGLLQFIDTSPANVCHSGFVITAEQSLLPGLYYHLPSAQHLNSGTLSFADGHIESHRWLEKETVELARKNSVPDHIKLQFPGNKDLRWLQERASVPK